MPAKTASPSEASVSTYPPERPVGATFGADNGLQPMNRVESRRSEPPAVPRVAVARKGAWCRTPA